jgi:hypothetical protein
MITIFKKKGTTSLKDLDRPILLICYIGYKTITGCFPRTVGQRGGIPPRRDHGF